MGNAKVERVDPQVEHGMTALCTAASVGALEIIDELIKAGADVNTSSATQKTPLSYAAGEGHLAIVRRLIAAGAGDLRAALYEAVFHNRQQVAEELTSTVAMIHYPCVTQTPRVTTTNAPTSRSDVAGSICLPGRCFSWFRFAL